MKIGVKTFKNKLFLESFESNADFFEIMAIEEVNFEFLKNFSVPIIVHTQHEDFKINNADKSIYEKNLKSINYAINIANNIQSKKIITHPGYLSNKNCSFENAINILKKINDERIFIENVPKNKKYFNLIGTTPKEMKELLEKTNKKFCFDINHAIETALFLNKNYIEFIKEFLELNPAHYHLGGQNMKTSNLHLCFKESTIDIKEILKLLPQDAEITLEVTTDISKTNEDIKFIRDQIKNTNNLSK